MTKIANTNVYIRDTNITVKDFIIGTDGDNADQTKNFYMGDIQSFVLAGLSPVEGGTLKITEFVYNGVLTSPAAVANAYSPKYTVAQYEIVMFTVNGNSYLLKLQDFQFGVTTPAITDSNFITIAAFLPVGTGAQTYQGYNVATKQHEFRSIISEGNDVSLNAGEIIIDPKAGSNLGDGQIVYKGLNGSKIHEFYTLVSDDMSISLDGNEIRFTLPTSATIPALYVNSAYVPTYDEWLKYKSGSTYKGSGTLSRPYTNTITYTDPNTPVITPNTAVGNAKTAYIGTGSVLAPEFSGYEIRVQNNPNATTEFSEDLSVSNINIVFEGSVKSTTTGKLIDMDDATKFNQTNASAIITVLDGATLEIVGTGLFNSGNSQGATTYATAKQIILNIDGQIFTEYNGGNVLTQYIINSDTSDSGNNNDGNTTFSVNGSGMLRAKYQGIYSVGGVSRIDFYNKLQSGETGVSVNTNLQAFKHTGGSVRFFDSALISSPSTRLRLFDFLPDDYDIDLIIFGSSFSGVCQYVFYKRSDDNDVNITCIGSIGGDFTCTQIFRLSGVSTEPIIANYRNNYVYSAADGIGTELAVLLTASNTVSSVNTIGNNVIETLVYYATKEAAQSAGLPSGSAIIKRVTVNAGSFVVGQEYKIAVVGSTSFTSIGAAANTVGLYFTASGVGSGSGSAYLETRETL